MGPVETMAVPLRMSRMMASLLMARFIACRTRLSLRMGWRVLRATYQTAEELASATVMLGSLRRLSRLSGGTSMVRSISPVLMAASRAWASMMGTEMAWRSLGPAAPYWSVRPGT